MRGGFSDEICGIATAVGLAGVGILRISGERALQIALGFFRPKAAKITPRYLHYGWIEKEGRTLDEAMMVHLPGPKSFTAENMVEIHCHGSSLILNEVLRLCLQGGARLARPGEFTERAFVHGRIDLTQAEATNDLIHAKTELGLHMVVNQLKGQLFERIQEMKEKLSWILALINAGIDFPEEDVVFSHQEEILTRLADVEAELQRLLDHAEANLMVKEGYKLALVGEPNAGKSSLLNALLQEERAIVTPQAGTTRDLIEESINLGGIPLTLVDTAGIRQSDDLIEKIGIERSLSAMDKADMILWLVDAAADHANLPELQAHIAEDKPYFLVYNKMDLIEGHPKEQPFLRDPARILHVSTKKPQDIQDLKEELHRFLVERMGELAEGAALTNLRQQKAAQDALSAAAKAKESLLAQMGEELLSVDLANALQALGDIVGDTTPDEMLGRIFENFCIGK